MATTASPQVQLLTSLPPAIFPPNHHEDPSRILAATLRDLTTLPSPTLTTLLANLDHLRAQILSCHNARSPLLRLPPELRNRIFLLAMRGDATDQLSVRGHQHPQRQRRAVAPREPAWWGACRQVRGECQNVWYGSVAVWEEWGVDRECEGKVIMAVSEGEGGRGCEEVEGLEERKGEVVVGAPADREGMGEEGKVRECRVWRRMDAADVRALCATRSSVGMVALVTQPSYGSEESCRAAVETSTSTCPRRGIVRTGIPGCPQIKWWMR